MFWFYSNSNQLTMFNGPLYQLLKPYANSVSELDSTCSLVTNGMW